MYISMDCLAYVHCLQYFWKESSIIIPVICILYIPTQPPQKSDDDPRLMRTKTRTVPESDR